MKTQIVADTHGGTHFFDWAKEKEYRVVVFGTMASNVDVIHKATFTS